MILSWCGQHPLQAPLEGVGPLKIETLLGPEMTTSEGSGILTPKNSRFSEPLIHFWFSVWTHRERALPGPVLAAHRARLPHVHPRLLPHVLCIQGILIPHHLKGRPQKIAYFLSVSGSVTFWYGSGCGSGSSDPYLWLTDPDADPALDPALFVSDLQDANKK